MEMRTDDVSGIFQELTLEYPDYQVPFHGCLDEWVRQGVLLLNLSFTADIDGDAHGKIWLGIIDRVIKELSKKNTKMIYALWGSHIQEAIMPLLDNKCIVLSAGYPRYIKKFGEQEKQQDAKIDKRDKQVIENMKGSDTFVGINYKKKVKDEENKFVFLGCGHFKKINEILVSKEKKQVNWQVSYS